jgi:hypothetical protein
MPTGLFNGGVGGFAKLTLWITHSALQSRRIRLREEPRNTRQR